MKKIALLCVIVWLKETSVNAAPLNSTDGGVDRGCRLEPLIVI